MPPNDNQDVATDTRMKAASKKRLATELSTLRQGDLISMGAVTIVGYGTSDLRAAVDGSTPQDDLWSVTVESEVGWYAVLSQDCDIVRDPADEPCLLVCPLKYVNRARWSSLRHGPYSPREFPFPDDRPRLDEGQHVVADLRYVTSLDKQALLKDEVETLRPLTPPQQQRFQAWVGRRFWRAPISDAVNEDVLGPVAQTLLSTLSKANEERDAGRNPNASGQFMWSVGEWMVGGSERLVQLVAFTSEALMREAGLPSDPNQTSVVLESGRDFLEKKLRRGLPAGKGYAITLEIVTLDKIRADRYRDLSPWSMSHREILWA